jgi:glycosyltransferase involved in cell wall biosynthesis
MRVVLSHPVGNANVRAILNGLNDVGMLHSFYTTVATFPSSFFQKLSTIPGFGELRRRTYNKSFENRTHMFPFVEAARLLSMRMGWKQIVRHEEGLFCFDKVTLSLDRHTANNLEKARQNGADAVYAYEDCALQTFREAKKLGLKCIYDLPIAYWELSKKLLTEEAERLPQWKITLAGGIRDSPEKLLRKTEEFSLADIIVTPGSFVAESLPNSSMDKKVILSAFGTPQPGNQISQKVYVNKGPLRVLFVGSMGQRKGLGDLFAAINLLNTESIQLIVMGSLLADEDFYRKQCPAFVYEHGRSHEQVLKLMQSCDVLCLPSIVEGRALVMQEAMSQGLPIIITENTGGADLIIEGETGFLVPIRSPEAIAGKLSLLATDRSLVKLMGEKARLHALKYTWEKYSKEIINSLAE